MPSDLSEVDLTDLDTFAGGIPHDIFRLHREQAPVWWHEPTDHTPDGEGFWSVALTAPAQWTRSNRHTGIRHLPLRLHKAPTTLRSATGM